MRRARLTALCLLALLALSAPAAAGARHGRHRHKRAAPDSCAVAHKHVLAAGPQAQVYVLSTLGQQGQQEVFACAKGARRSFSLGPPPACDTAGNCVGVETFALAGSVVAFGSTTIIEPTLPSEAAQRRFLVQVRDLRTNRMLRIAPTGLPGQPKPGLTGIGRVRAIVVKSDGAVAWIAADETGAAPGAYEVGAADAAGLRLLAAGTGIDPGSLALTGSTLSWSQSGQAASSVLN